MQTKLALAVMCLVISACTPAPDPIKPSEPLPAPPDFLQVTQDFAQGRFLQAFLNREIVRSSSALYGQIHAAVGWIEEAKAATHVSLPECEIRAFDNTSTQEQYLAAQFAEYDVVILNESHERPRHRATAIGLLPILQQAGFDVFAAETFFDGIEAARERGYPLLKDGVYSKEPIFGVLVRTAAQYGFDMYRYEPMFGEFPEFGDDVETREKGQARLIGDLVRSHADRKIFVYSARGHFREHITGTDGAKIRLMGWFLKNDEGINALTISQTSCAETGLGGGLIGKGASVPGDPQIDTARVLPETTYKSGRPDWLWEIGLRPIKMPPIDETLTDTSYVLVEVYNPNEHNEAVPVDRLIVRKNEGFVLAAPHSGNWHWRVIDEADTVIGTGALSNIQSGR